MFTFIHNSVRFIHYRWIAVPLLAAGPCFKVDIETNVKIERDGSSARHVSITTDQFKHAALLTELPQNPDKELALVILTNNGFDRVPRGPGIPSDGSKWTRTRGANANERVSDLSLHRRGRGEGATNEAIVTVDQYIIFQRIRYKETIRDSATRESMTQAADKVASQFSEALKLASRELLSSSFDLKVFENYLQTAFRKEFREFLVRTIGAHGNFSEMLRVLGDSLTASAIPYDFNALARLLKSESLATDDLELTLNSIVDGMLTKLATLLRRPGATPENPGQPVKAEELILLKTPGLAEQAISRALENQSNSTIRKFDELVQSAGSELFGSFGGAAFDPDLGSAEIRWKTTLQMPGRLLKTSGVPLEDGSILWLQLKSDLATRVNVQEAESIVMDARAITALGGNASNVTAEQILELLATLGDGRERTPNRECIAILKNAMDGTEEATAIMKKDDRLEPVRRILQIK
ncbi:MAG: hypothetical protein ACKVS6_06475 [Planctomycetota bacterium]